MRIKKKHQAGAAKNFITRTQAVKKLQLTLADFRRICIFKGIFPRAPRSAKKANKGSTAPTTFYYTKDIQYLLHEPVIQRFRDHKVFARKLSRALGRGEVAEAKRLDDGRPRYTLDRIVKERYPTFVDAIRDLDDALSMLFLFAVMPATDKVSARVTADAERLCNQWMAYIARERLLRKVFVSIKGVYYEAEVRGQEVVWLVPFKFPQNVPADVDFRIMLTFLEFYTTLLQFVLFKLYSDTGLVYPPRIDVAKEQGVGGISAYIVESKKEVGYLATGETTGTTHNMISEAEMRERVDTIPEVLASIEKSDDTATVEDTATKEENVEEERDEQVSDKLDSFTALPSTDKSISDILQQPDEISAEEVLTNLFSPFTFYIGREVPLDLLEFTILSLGGSVVSESALDTYLALDEDSMIDVYSGTAEERKTYVDNLLAKVTHQICDRPALFERVPGRIYIQPQWVFDSLNNGALLSVDDYAVGATLPPHLSPWGDGAGYDPTTPSERAGVVEEEDEAVPAEVDEEKSEDEVAAVGDDEVGDGESDEEVEDSADTVSNGEEEDEAEDEVLQYQRELESEASGVMFSTAAKVADAAADKKRKRVSSSAAQTKANGKKQTPEEKQAAEEKELRKIMMTNKQKKLYNQMQYGINKKEQRQELLKSKRQKLEIAQKRKNLNTPEGGKNGQPKKRAKK
ncbi:nucleolar protein [Limtongia smithiae]|uniref:nucleolar protein n=1 Tax=Limtongia smithiae TaxID=1125753 RepID=UPI0034CEFCFB